MDELGRPSVETFREATRIPVMLVLDQIRSMQNVGAIFRSSDAFSVEGICLCGYTPKPPHRDIEKTALGATATVPWLAFDDTIQACHYLREKGYRLLGIEQVHSLQWSG